MSGIKQYAERDAMALDEAGGYYMRHIMAMTGEKLHGKGDIAAELGWRDMQIAALQQKLDAVLAENVALKEGNQLALDIICDDNTYVALPWQSSIGKVGVETPATDAMLNEVRAEGLKMAIDHMNNQTSDDCADVTVLPVIEMYNQLRAGSTEGGV